MYEFDFSVIWDNWPIFLRGALLTIWLTFTAMCAALVIAVLTVAAKRSQVRLLRVSATVYIEAIRNTPFLVQVFFIYFALPSLWVSLTPNWAAFTALALNGGAYGAEIIRGGFQAISRGQWDAGSALGLGKFQVARFIIFRQALKNVYPSLTSQFILLLLTSSAVASISAAELTSLAQLLDSNTFRSFEIYISVAIIYLGLSMGFMKFFSLVYENFITYPAR